MAKNAVSDWSTTASENTDVGGINIDSSGNISQGDDAIREMMAQIKTGIAAGSFASPVPFTAASASGAASLAFAEDTDNGSNTVSIQGPASVSANVVATLTDQAGLIVTAPADPNADRIVFWDDSAGLFKYLAPSTNLVISGTDIRVYETWAISVSDETTAITTGTAKASWVFPYAFTVVGVAASLNTASSSGTPTFDINEAGTTILSTKIVIDANEKTGGSSGYQGTAAGAAVISDTSIAAFAEMTVDIDTAGTGAKGAKVYVIGYAT
jgi:hypothetical protein